MSFRAIQPLFLYFVLYSLIVALLYPLYMQCILCFCKQVTNYDSKDCFFVLRFYAKSIYSSHVERGQFT